MLKKILFVFSGTGDNAKSNHSVYEYNKFPDDVVRVYFSGCQDKSIGGASPGLGYISPNLDTAAGKVRESFDANGQLSLSRLKREFGNSIIIEPQNSTEDTSEIESINLIGFSRGAVTTFAVARHLDELGIPMRLFASDPVPGNSIESSKKNSSEFYKNHDLRGCRNLVEAQVMLGSYKNNVNVLHNKYLRQMAPVFSDHCNSAIYTVPKTHHFHWSKKALNQEIDFLVKGSIKPENTGYYDEKYDGMTFTPKVIQQKHHMGAVGRLEMLPRYKTALFQVVSNLQVSQDTPVKVAQSLYALDQVRDFDAKNSLVSTVRTDTTPRGKAVREFIVEFENINQYVFRKDKQKQDAMKEFWLSIHNKLISFPAERTPEQRQQFADFIANKLKEIKKELSSSEHKKLSSLVSSLFENKESLISNVLTNSPSKKEAAEELVAECDNITKTVLKEAKTSQAAMEQFRVSVHNRLNFFPIEQATPEQKKQFTDFILNELNTIKSQLPSEEYTELSRIMRLFLKDNIIFHPDLTQYLDETETFSERPANLKTPEQAMMSLSSASTGAEIAEILYHMSESSRECAYDQFPENLNEVITDAKQLGDVLRFLPIKHIEKILKNESISGLIKSVEDLNSIMKKMFHPSQQDAVSKIMKNNVNTMNLNFGDLGDFMQYLSSSQCQNLMASLNFSKIQNSRNPGKDLILYFDKLNEKQFNKVFPEIASYLKRLPQEAFTLEFVSYLGKRLTDLDEKTLFFNEIIVSGKEIKSKYKEQLSRETDSTAHKVGPQ